MSTDLTFITNDPGKSLSSLVEIWASPGLRDPPSENLRLLRLTIPAR
jgi:hypothetical protein